MSLASAGQWAAAQTVQIAVLFALVFALDALVARRGSLRLRAALWAAFFVKLALPPQVFSPVSLARLFDERSGVARFIQEPAPAAQDPHTTFALVANVVLAAWAVGFCASLWIAAARLRRAQAEWISGSRSASRSAVAHLDELAERLGIARSPRLKVRDDVESAAAVGCWAPVIVVPARLLERDAQRELEHVLLHELAHVRRRDALQDFLWTVACCVYWFHPLVHVAARRAALVREMACDERAASCAREGAAGYRRTLLAMARPLLHRAASLSAFGDSGGSILLRLERLDRPRVPGASMGASRSARRFDAAAVAAFVLLCVCCVPLGAAPLTAHAGPSIDEVQGCMRKRYLVMAELARIETARATARN